MDNNKPYPVSLTVDYPEQPRDRASVFFRLILVIPVAILVALLVGTSYHYGFDGAGRDTAWASAGCVVAPTLLMLLFRRKYPRWWFDWNLNVNRFLFRVSAYVGLLRDEYPSTDEDQAVHLEFTYPDAKTELNQWLPLVKWFLVIPHVIVLCFVDIAAYVCVIIAWFAILFTGKFEMAMSGSELAALPFLTLTTWFPGFRICSPSAKSTFAADADRNAPLILARRHLDPGSHVIAALARQRPWLTRLFLRVPVAHWLKSSPSGLVLARARLVDSCGHPWASTLVPLVFRVTRPAAFAMGPPWSQMFDDSLATLEQDARRHVERWAALNRAAIQRLVHHIATRAGVIDASIRADRRRSAAQPDLFVPASQPAAARPRRRTSRTLQHHTQL